MKKSVTKNGKQQAIGQTNTRKAVSIATGESLKASQGFKLTYNGTYGFIDRSKVREELKTLANLQASKYEQDKKEYQHGLSFQVTFTIQGTKRGYSAIPLVINGFSRVGQRWSIQCNTRNILKAIDGLKVSGAVNISQVDNPFELSVDFHNFNYKMLSELISYKVQEGYGLVIN